MRKRFPVTLSFDDGLISQIDARRGMIPRSIFVENLLLDLMGSENNEKTKNT